ncbi:hypothetical protein [Pseudarthrobacter sp. PH31-O2]|uniref:hypothetical protein n=1 Tax=Pseudarthrobacter sp. PH31-O2 TaxID=3046206 RepID=UPI0024B977D0|nr:hypothetical protein [Pseudarthrobacter sp. PH31-O2]MDJ0353374.1 hypothetical protein [Pseudarthrobacter sp. PH31-O2]
MGPLSSFWGSGGQRSAPTLDDGGSDEARTKAVRDLLAASGMVASAEGVQEVVAELIVNGFGESHEGVQLDVIWYDPVEDAVSTPRGDGDEAGNKVLEFAERTCC